jgi:ATP-dependent DNA helicase RecG
MGKKHWIETAQECLEECLAPVPHEVNELDWKVRLSENKERLIEHLIASANHPDGACLVFGVADDGHPRGVDAESVARISNTLANLGRDAVEPCVAIDHSVTEFRGVPLLFVRVPEHSNKPVHRRGKSVEESWIRSGGTTRKASRHEIGMLMLNSATPSWETLRASGLMSLDEVRTALDFDAVARLLCTPLPDDPAQLARWVQDEGLAVAEGRGHYVTNLGAIAAARRLSDFDTLKRKAIRVVRYRGTNKVETVHELSGRRGYAVGFEGLIDYLKRILPHSEAIDSALRTDVSGFPDLALRELVANALIHQDFSITGAGPMIGIFDDRIEVTNPGSLLPGKRPDRLIGTTPESRNEKLAWSFRRYRICEERGTGFQKVVNATEVHGLPPLIMMPIENAFRVTLYAPRSFAELTQAERIEICYQHAVLKYLSSKTLTNASLRQRFRLHDRQRTQIGNVIAGALEAGRIKRKDLGAGKKFAEYLPYWV